MFQARDPVRLCRVPEHASPLASRRLIRRRFPELAIWCLLSASCLAFCMPAVGRSARVSPIHSIGKLDAAYEATLLGFPIGDVTWTIDFHDNRYSAAAQGATAGLLLIFSRGHGTAEADGSVAGKEPLASNFLLDITHGSASQQVKILFNRGKASESLEPPPKPNPQLVPLNEAYRTGVVDPMSALLVNVPGNVEMAGPAACARTIAVFDGRMRFNLKLAFKRIEQVQVQDGYQGPAAVCAVYLHPIGGIRSEPLCDQISASRARHGNLVRAAERHPADGAIPVFGSDADRRRDPAGDTPCLDPADRAHRFNERQLRPSAFLARHCARRKHLDSPAILTERPAGFTLGKAHAARNFTL